ncbi:hypothetical protein M5K25_018690 [Dendrobium thyrsiflorum]|uniref:DUF1501 domain-containing protein n=1 Tax=Dendrobium thyrsiflorum TaxID=117978 RepID=A0ABD0UJ90_DENTH
MTRECGQGIGQSGQMWSVRHSRETSYGWWRSAESTECETAGSRDSGRQRYVGTATRSIRYSRDVTVALTSHGWTSTRRDNKRDETRWQTRFLGQTGLVLSFRFTLPQLKLVSSSFTSNCWRAVGGGKDDKPDQDPIVSSSWVIMIQDLLKFDAVEEHTGSDHDRNLMMSFGSKTIRSEGPDHNRLPVVPFDGKTTGTEASTRVLKIVHAILQEHVQGLPVSPQALHQASKACIGGLPMRCEI